MSLMHPRNAMQSRRAIEKARATSDWCAEAKGTMRPDIADAYNRAVMDGDAIAVWVREMNLTERFFVLSDQRSVHVFIMDDQAACLFRLVHGDSIINWDYRGENFSTK